MLWEAPADIAGEDLYWGSGGQRDAPHGDMRFLKEDLNGSTAKYDVRDRQGEKWTLKLDQEAQPETVASRLVWAMGYGTREDYVVPDMRIEGLPAHLQRGRKMILPGGEVRNVRLEKLPAGEKRVGRWQWRQNPFENTRAFDGLRVMMALINNWDLMDYNTSIYQEKDGGPLQYVVSDLGASFGTTGQRLSAAVSKGNVTSYAHSRFVNKVTPAYVDFNMPTMPSLPLLVVFPREFVQRLHLRWIGKRVPRDDAAWIGGLLAQLTDAQIRDAFRSANYSDAEVAEYAAALEARIRMLQELSGPVTTR
ncbi:MAG TPA: hypothetical protein VN515_08380 [Terriglobales bacterium]|nr:hypothetical protein [Terriglobales bacterium]